MPSRELIFLIDGDYIKLGNSEIKSLGDGKIIKEGRTVVFDGKIDYKRLAFSKIVCEKLCEGNSLEKVCQQLKGSKLNNFSVNAIKISSKVSQRLAESKIGSCFTGKVNLSNPQNLIHVFLDKKIYVGKELYDRRASGFAERRPMKRPGFHPSSMKPTLARGMVNLSQVKKRGGVLDPFCGVGGILIEAGLIGCVVEGIDLNKKMVENCKKNLKYYGVKGSVKQGNALDIEKGYDVIVTDMPYGRAASLFKKNRSELYKKFLKRVEETIGSGRAIIGASVDLRKKTSLKCCDLIKVKVHKELERKIHVFER